MKIGILTFHRAFNYGAVLQCYALFEVLKSMGHEVEVIDYRPPYIEKYRKLFYGKGFRKQGAIQKLKTLALLPHAYVGKRKAAKAFDSFLKSNLCFSRTVYAAKDIPIGYDRIVFGSDQIWNPMICEGFDPVFWGQFPKGNTQFITYAASLGGHNKLTPEMWNTIRQNLRAYDKISVREDQLRQSLLKNANVDVPTVVDPTLLVSKDVLEKIAVKPQEENYVLLFTLEENNQAKAFAKRIAEQEHCEVIRLRATPFLRNKEKDIKTKDAITPGEFCGYFKYARFIVAISFHGTAFSVIFNKNFYTLHSQREDRALNLLKAVGLESRLISPTEVNDICGVDYSLADSRIEKLRQASMRFLADSISVEGNK